MALLEVGSWLLNRSLHIQIYVLQVCAENYTYKGMLQQAKSHYLYSATAYSYQLSIQGAQFSMSRFLAKLLL